MLKNTKILDVIACPICKGRLKLSKSEKELICVFDKLAFPIVNGVPIMMLSRAKSR